MSSSFEGVKKRLPKNEQILLDNIHKEGEELVPNNYQPIKEEVMTSSKGKETKKPNIQLRIGVGVAFAALATCAIVIPVVAINTQPLTADAACEITLENQSTGETLEACCDVNADGNIKDGVVYPENELAKKVLSGIEAKEYKVNSQNIKEYITDLISFGFNTKDPDNNYIFDGTAEYSLSINVLGEGYFKEDPAEILQSLFSKKINEYSNNISIFVSKETTINNELGSKQFIIEKLKEKLFAENTTLLDGFDLENDVLDKALETLQTLRNIYKNIKLDSDLQSFRNDLIEAYTTYNKTFNEIDFSSTDWSAKSYWDSEYWLNYWNS